MINRIFSSIFGRTPKKDYYVRIKVPNAAGALAKVLTIKQEPALMPVRKVVSFLSLENRARPAFSFQETDAYIPYSERTESEHNLFAQYVCKALAVLFEAHESDFAHCDVDMLLGLYAQIVEDLQEVQDLAKATPINTIQLLGRTWQIPNVDFKNRLEGITVHQMMQIDTLKASILDPDYNACPFEVALKTIAIALMRKNADGRVDRVLSLEGARFKALEKAPYIEYLKLCFFLTNRMQECASMWTILQVSEASARLITEMYQTPTSN